jgi:hypothetical protein
MFDISSIANISITIIFYAVTAVMAALSAAALYILNKHGENQTISGTIGLLYGLLFLIIVSTAFASLTTVTHA